MIVVYEVYYAIGLVFWICLLSLFRKKKKKLFLFFSYILIGHLLCTNYKKIKKTRSLTLRYLTEQQTIKYKMVI